MDRDDQTVLMDLRRWLAGAGAVLGAYALLRALGTARRPAAVQSPERPPRAVVLGGGFAGLEAARTLQRLLTGRCVIVLIDRHNYQLFTPLLFQVATCGIDPYSITYPLRHFSDHRGIIFRTGTVEGIDFERRRVKLQEGGEIGFDYLVIALGSSTDFQGSKSSYEHSLPLKSVGDGIAIRNHVLDMLERGSQIADPAERQSLLTFAVVGGGSTGTETAAALAELLSHTVPSDFPGISRHEPHVTVLEASERLLGHMKDPAPAKALSRLRRKGVEVHFDTRVRDVGPDRLTTEDGRTISTHTIIWTAGVRAPQVVASLPVQHGDEGTLAVDPFLQLRGRPGIYAVGDCAHVEDDLTRQRVPWLAAAAIQQGRVAAENIARHVEGRPQNSFQFRNPGTLISLGRSDGLAQFGRLVLSGAPGALAWHAVHLMKIPTLRERISTALDWSAGYVHDKDTTRLEVRPETTQPETGRVTEGESG